ncbi:DUF6119 family protein [Sphingopyxis sp.]|jgi:uncharacterized protein (TIGR04141 family)|uniref:DUF6119 family protein n=1 Tax=Sphingopyxis sp. TaxID=1908224 RepID=UPI002DF0BBE1|nr:DUF6119 family protein [Sphingopyxis sp.]
MAENSGEIGQITFYLAKSEVTFESIFDDDAGVDTKLAARTVDFEIEDAVCRFAYFETYSARKNPPWLEFVNEQMGADLPFEFADASRSPNGILLLQTGDRLFAAVFGRSAASCLNKKMLEPDFGIKTAMNMCGNEEIRQTRTQSNAITPTHIDRQASKPSDTFVFGLSEAEDLRYISAHIKGQKHTTLQGRDSLTVKVIGEEKLGWDSLVEKCQTFLERFGARDYIDLFPNYRNFQPASEAEVETLDGFLINALRAKDYARIDLSIPEFLADEDYGYSYSNKPQKENIIYSFLEPAQIEKVFKDSSDITVDRLQTKRIHAYSPAEDRILGFKRWPIYDCLIYEHAIGGDYFVLSSGRWTKVDPEFHQSILDFMANRVREEPAEALYSGIDISDDGRKINSEAKFNREVVARRPSTILFDQAKLKIGTGLKNKEFCDILDLEGNGRIRIINAKQYKDASSINYLFSQAKFYCEAFLTDDVFLKEIRGHISDSGCAQTDAYLAYIKPAIEDNHGRDYSLCLWLLYCDKKPQPDKSDIPLIAQYELKLMHDHLRRICKFRDIIIRFIPVKTKRYTQSRKNKPLA